VPAAEYDQERLRRRREEAARTIEIDEFVPKAYIGLQYLIRPYYLAPLVRSGGSP
jgi:non-homologous end joining protein Ku